MLLSSIDLTLILAWIAYDQNSNKAPVTLYCDPTALARRFEISQSAVGSHENTKKCS